MILAYADDPLAMWCLAIAVVVTVSVASFVAGVMFERSSVERAIHNARQSVGRLFSMANRQLKRAEAGCSAMERLQDITLSPSQRDQLVDRQSRLGDSLKRILDRAQQAIPLKSAASRSKPIALSWVSEPLDPVVGLPDRSALDANLLQLLEANQGDSASCGMGLIRIDRLDRITARFGEERQHEIRQRISEIIASSLPESSCQCVFAEDTFAVVQPNVDTAELIAIANGIRQSVRSHQFRSEETGVETLVTASLGFCVCDGSESAAMLRSRCLEALSRSEQRGRNQLHCHDGERILEGVASRDLESTTAR